MDGTLADAPAPTDDPGSRLDRVPTPLLVFALLVAVYAPTAVWSLPYHIDPLTNAVTSWYLAHTGSPVAEGYEDMLAPGQRGNTGWFVPSSRGPVSQYPPGAALTGAPLALLDRAEPVLMETGGTNRPELGSAIVPMPAVWPATLTAVLVTAAAGAAVAATVAGAGLGRGAALLTGAATGLTTSLWGVASAMSWTHGPTALAVSLGVLAASRGRWAWAGAAFGYGILVRPHVAVLAAVLGLVVGWRRHDWRPVLGIGVTSGIGLLLYVSWNAAVFGRFSLSGGYGDAFGEQALAGDWASFAANVLDGMTGARYGLLLWAPHVVLLVVAAFRQRDRLPDWSVAAALGGLAYLLLQWKANRASGGAGFFPYRYPIAAIVAAAPLLGITAVHAWREGGRLTRYPLLLATMIAVIGQVVGVLVHAGWD